MQNFPMDTRQMLGEISTCLLLGDLTEKFPNSGLWKGLSQEY